MSDSRFKISDSRIWLSVALIALTLAVFLQVRHFGFVTLDDPLYVSENAHVASGLTTETVRWAFATTESANWHPLTWLSHALDVELFGLDPGAHHVSSVVLHILNTLVLFWLLCRMMSAVWPSAFVAALFAIHPLHVESVAWVAERKDVLSTLFWLLTMWAYLAYVQRPGARRYGAVVMLFALGLMAKPMLVTLPFALLLLDFWPLGRVGGLKPSPPAARRRNPKEGPASAGPTGSTSARFWPLVGEKLPLFALAAAASVVAFVAQRQAGAVSQLEYLAVPVRIASALTSYAQYLSKTFWPVNLSGFYPHTRDVAGAQVVIAVLVLAAVTIAALKLARRSPSVVIGWFWFLGTLVPVIGLVQVGLQAMADRYTYVPLIGLFVAVTWLALDVARARAVGRRVLPVLAVVIVALLAVRARAQVQQWRDSTTFWTAAATAAFAVTDYQAHLGIGRVLSDQGRTVEAYDHFLKAAQLQPDSAAAQYMLGATALRLGRADEAIGALTRAVELQPSLAEARHSLAFVLAQQGRRPEAIAHYQEAVRLQPGVAALHNDFGLALYDERRVAEAQARFEEAVRLKPDLAGPHNNLGIALAVQGKLAEAAQHFAEAVRLDPTFEEARLNLARARAALGR
jgi:Tfp pilus assembly protein PilF